MRFRYQHETLRNASIVSGNSSSQGWFIDEILATGFEAVSTVTEAAFTSSSFTLDDITSFLDSASVIGDDEDDRFLLCISGLHSGTGFSESMGYGKPYVIRVRTSYEQFMYDNYTESERANLLISGKTADSDGDGIVNLLEHAFGTDPGEVGGNPLTISGGSSQPTITFPWNPDTGHSYTLQMGNLDDEPFADIAFTETSETIGGVLMISLTPHASVSVPTDKAFFRVKVQ